MKSGILLISPETWHFLCVNINWLHRLYLPDKDISFKLFFTFSLEKMFFYFSIKQPSVYENINSKQYSRQSSLNSFIDRSNSHRSSSIITNGVIIKVRKIVVVILIRQSRRKITCCDVLSCIQIDLVMNKSISFFVF